MRPQPLSGLTTAGFWMARVLAVAIIVLVGTSPPAGAAPATVTIDGSTVVTVNDWYYRFGPWLRLLSVQYSGAMPGQPVFITACGTSADDPTFAGYDVECDPYAEYMYPNPTGAGVERFELSIDEPQVVGGRFFCKSPGGPPDWDTGAGYVIRADASCFVRVTFGTADNESDAVYFPIVYPVIVPESPASVLLVTTAGAGALVAGYLSVQRLRVV